MYAVKFCYTILILVIFIYPAFAKDIHIKGYYRSDGTYVPPHIRSSPDKHRFNNYGPSRNRNELMNPRMRDSDHDGIPNYIDKDDDNDGVPDDMDRSQY